MIKTKAIDHVCLWVRSLSEAKEYYEKVFGFVCAPKKEDETVLVIESDNVHFFLSECNNKNDIATKLLSKQHISFEVESINRVVKELKAFDITGYDVGEVRFFVHNNYNWCEWRDPSGIRLECVEKIK